MAADPIVAGVAEEIARHKARAYTVVLLVAIMVTVVVLFVEFPDDVFVERVYPLLATLLSVVLFLHLGRWVSLEFVEASIVAFAGTAVMLRLADLLVVRPPPIADRLLAISGGVYWAVVVLLVLCFVLFDRRRAVAVASALWALSLGLAIVGLLRDAGAHVLDPLAVISLGRVHGFLAATIAVVAAAGAMREQLHRALERAEVLQERALTDPLTGLANRYAGNERLAEEGADARRRHRPLSVAMFDLDHFKRINDEHGHATGDKVLVSVANAVSAMIRPRDLLVRWGGEEFLVILPETTLAHAEAIADRMRHAVRQACQQDLKVTATFGVAELDEEERLEHLLMRADKALYEGKDAGRDRVVADVGVVSACCDLDTFGDTRSTGNRSSR